MNHLHPVFNVVKLTQVPTDPIPGRRAPPPPPPEIIDEEEEWVVEEILNSRMINQSYGTLSSGRDLAWNITLGNYGTMFMLLTSSPTFTGNTLVPLAKSELLSLMGYHFTLFTTLQCRDVTPLTGRWMSGNSQFLTHF
jgi:hypothetical protein